MRFPAWAGLLGGSSYIKDAHESKVMAKVWLVTGSAAYHTLPSGLLADSPRPWPREWPVGRQRLCARTRKHADKLGHLCEPRPPDPPPDYAPSVGAVASALKPLWGQADSDPAKVVQVILRLAASDRLPAHLLPGSDAVQFAEQAEAARAADARVPPHKSWSDHHSVLCGLA
jgi:hypothetical protein